MIYDRLNTPLVHSPRGVLLSEDYRDEVYALMNEGILTEMEKDLGIEWDLTAYPDQFEMTMQVNAEYRRRGGVEQHSIGGPLWALKELHTIVQRTHGV